MSHIPTIVTVTDRENGGPFSFGVEHLHSYFPEPLDEEAARQRVPGTNIVIMRPPLFGSEDKGGAIVFGIRESYTDFQRLLERAGVQIYGLGPIPARAASKALHEGTIPEGWG